MVNVYLCVPTDGAFCRDCGLWPACADKSRLVGKGGMSTNWPRFGMLRRDKGLLCGFFRMLVRCPPGEDWSLFFCRMHRGSRFDFADFELVDSEDLGRSFPALEEGICELLQGA